MIHFRTVQKTISIRIKEYMFTVFIMYFVSMIIFVLLSYINNYQVEWELPGKYFDIILSVFIPYSPIMICGFLMGNLIFVCLWVGVVERFIWNRMK